MRAHQHISDIRNQSRIGTPKQNLWFFSDDQISDQLPDKVKKSIKNDRARIFDDDYIRYSQAHLELSKAKKQCTFIVDWQLEDSF